MTDSASSSVPLRVRTWLREREALVSRLLIILTVVAYSASLYLFFNWRYNRMVSEACEVSSLGDYSQSQFCLDIKGWMGWVTGLIEAIPFTAATMLALLGLVYWLLGEWLDLRPNPSWRRAVLIVTAAYTACIGGIILVMMGAVMLFI